MALPPTTGAPLDLYIPAFDYGTNPGDETWDQPINVNWETINTFAGTVALLTPTASQTIAQPASTYLNIDSLIVYGSTPALRLGTAVNVWDTSLSRTAAGKLSVDTNTVGNGSGVLTAAGYQIGGTVPSGHILLGNGTSYVDSATIPTSAANYQIIESNGTPLTQRNKLNFLTPLTAVDDSGNASTDIGLGTSGVTAGSYTSANITVAANGLVTAAANGAPVSTVTRHTVTGSRSLGTAYPNPSTSNSMKVAVSIFLTGTYGEDSSIAGEVGLTSGSMTYAASASVLNAGGKATLWLEVPVGSFYEVNQDNQYLTNPVTPNISVWDEYY